MKNSCFVSSVTTAAGVLLLASTGLAQGEPEAAPAPAEAAPAPAAAAAAPAEATPPPPAPAATASAAATTEGGAAATAGVGSTGNAAAAVPTGSDHDQMVGSFAVGYLGRRTVAYGTGSALAGTARGVAQAPVIGIRFWATPLLGIDAGIGFALVDDGKTEDETTVGGVTTSTEAELAPLTAFVFHAGVPLALANSGHFSFQVVPEVNVGFATQTVQPAVDAEDKSTGFTFDIGARGGGEVHFGFIGVPQLALQGSIGLLYRYENWKVESVAAADAATHSETRGNFTTTVFDNPWNIFTSNVAALYYF